MIWNVENNLEQIKAGKDYINPAELIRRQAELDELKRQNGGLPECGWLCRQLDRLAERDRSCTVNRRKYLKLALCCGWFTGLHRFYAGQKLSGLLYLIFCWTGVPFAMTLLDIMYVLPKVADCHGEITL